jgi:hypothetical protein
MHTGAQHNAKERGRTKQQGSRCLKPSFFVQR